MGLRLWLDDRRTPPWGYDLHAKTAVECCSFLSDLGVAEIEHVSLDHDLDESHYGYGLQGGSIDRTLFSVPTGLYVVEFMVMSKLFPKSINVHTLNPRGAEDMLSLLLEQAPVNIQLTRIKATEI